jgi:hypothetical protein
VITSNEFVQIEKRILQALRTPLHSKELMDNLHGVRTEKAWEVINFLEGEKRIEVTKAGMITRTGTGI